MINFFKNSNDLDWMVLKPLSHIYLNWELTWNEENNKYEEEKNSLSEKLNNLITEIHVTSVPKKYHDNEDILVEYVNKDLTIKLKKIGNMWVCGNYASLLETGGFGDINEINLVKACAGRIQAAIKYGQSNFDDMDKSHKRMLSYILSIILYHRAT